MKYYLSVNTRALIYAAHSTDTFDPFSGSLANLNC